MTWADCENAWKRQGVQPAGAAELAALEAGFESERRKLARARFVRRVVEGSMGPVVCLGLVAAWWITGRGGWPTLAAVLLILGGFAAVWFASSRRRRSLPGPEAPLLVKVEADIADLQRQRRQLLTMRTWHFGPVYAALLLIPFVLALKSGAQFAVAFAIYYAAMTLLCWAHNRVEVRRRIDPRLDELEKLRDGLAAGA
jgi:hypothetical protein